MSALWLNKNQSISTSVMFDKNHSRAEGDLVLIQVKKNWKKKRKGYREGVFLVPINPKFFKSNIVKLKDEDYLFGQFERRVDTEEPRKKVSALANSTNVMPLKGCEVVVYSKEVLAEGNERSSVSDFEVLIVLKKVVKGNQPMPPDTMMYNFFKANGGTDMKCTDVEFVKQLKESFLFWKDKAIIH